MPITYGETATESGDVVAIKVQVGMVGVEDLLPAMLVLEGFRGLPCQQVSELVSGTEQ